MKKKQRGIYKLSDPKRKAQWCWERKENGKRIRTFFFSFEEAAFCKRTAEAEARAHGASSRMMFSGLEQKEYRTAKEIVGDVSLIDVALFYRDHKDRFTTKKALVGVVAEDILIHLAENGTNKHRKKIERWFGRFCERFKGRMFDTITQEEVLKWLKGLSLSPATIRDATTITTFLYNKAKALGYTKELPVFDRSFMPKKELKEVEVYSTEEIRQILSYAHKTCPIWLPNIALRCFVGLRTAEASKMLWEWIDVDRRRILIPAEICKTRDAWVLQSPNLPDTVFKWLEQVPREKRVGKIPVPPVSLGTVIKLPLKNNGFRHTFCTMHISLYGSADKTATLLKHKGTSMLYKHYLGKLVSEEEARAYFALTPQSLSSSEK